MHAIRRGCYVKWEHSGKEYAGTVHDHYYTDDGHVFFVKLDTGSFYKATGAFLYSKVTTHIRGKESRKEEKKSNKRYRRRQRKRHRREAKHSKRPKRKGKFKQYNR